MVSLRPPFLAFVRGVRTASVITISSGFLANSLLFAETFEPATWLAIEDNRCCGVDMILATLLL